MCLKGMLFFQVDDESKEVAMQTNCYYLFIYCIFFTQNLGLQKGGSMFCLHLLFILGPHDRVLCSGTDKKVFLDSLVPNGAVVSSYGHLAPAILFTVLWGGMEKKHGK